MAAIASYEWETGQVTIDDTYYIEERAEEREKRRRTAADIAREICVQERRKRQERTGNI